MEFAGSSQEIIDSHSKYPFRKVHQLLLIGYIRLRKYKKAMKTALMLTHLMEPDQVSDWNSDVPIFQTN